MNSSSFAVRKMHVMFACIALALCAMVLSSVAEVKAQSPEATLTVEKEVLVNGVATTSIPYTNFSFLINGASTTAFDADGSVDIAVATGTSYDITEVNAPGYVTTYSNCDDIVLNTATSSATCTITNATTTPTPTPDPETGTLVVNKVVVGGPDATSSFQFTINGGATTAVEADGTNVFQNMATGTYTISEVPYANYTPTYNNCSSAVVTANATTTCTITNTFNVGGATLYTIDGYKWHDDDRDGVWDNDEDPLAGWTINASATGEITRTDVTDSNGYYSVLVPAGTWTVTEVQQNGWTQTFPDNDEHEFTFSTTSTTTADLNFGNDTDATSGGGGGGGGNGVRIELRDNDDDDEDDDDNDSGGGRNDDDDEDEDDDDDNSGGTGTTPGGVVLGDQTSVYPYGAPNTGLGGGELHKMDGAATLPLLSMIMVMLVGFGVARAMRDPRDQEEVI